MKVWNIKWEYAFVSITPSSNVPNNSKFWEGPIYSWKSAILNVNMGLFPLLPAVIILITVNSVRVLSISERD